jgi:hypothetical protein
MKITRYVITKYNYYLHDFCFEVKCGDDESNSSGFKSCCLSPSPCPSSTTTTAVVVRSATVRCSLLRPQVRARQRRGQQQ